MRLMRELRISLKVESVYHIIYSMRYLIIVITLFMLFTLPTISYAEEIGKASWYGGNEKLNKYASDGSVFDSSKMTCASYEYPLGTFLRVTNISNGKFIIVKVTDRGPNKRLKRKIDLTRSAFKKIAELKEGIILVKIEEVNHVR